MDKNDIKKYAVWAREELIKRVSTKAEEYGISKDEMVPATAESINGRLLTKAEISQRTKLISAIRKDGYEQVIEEVAYTWFNRFIALRFMEVNKLLPSRVRVFTNDKNEFKPQILAEALDVEIDGLDKEKVIELKKADKNEELYKYLLITQCNALSAVLPRMFQKIDDYTELLFPDNVLREGSVVERLVSWIDEKNWLDAVQIIGWLYQYYNSVPKDIVFANLKKNIKIKKEDIPAATQLFTPDWIVRYMVENSLGRLWVEGHPNDALKGKWTYYLDEAEQEYTVRVELEKLRAEYKTIKPEDIKCIDPCMGSGHILVYMFDILMDIYADYGYSPREAVVSIIENNLYGLDIDERAAQLSYFAVMMKACSYDKRFLNRKDENGNPNLTQPHVYAIVESNDLDLNGIDEFIKGDAEIKKNLDSLIAQMMDAKEYGSILSITGIDFPLLYKRLAGLKGAISMFKDVAVAQIGALIDVAYALAQKYDVVVTNPPYMSASGMSDELSAFVKENFPDEKTDLFAVFMSKCQSATNRNGYVSMITMQGWMFLSSFEKVRHKILDKRIESLLRIGYNSFPELNSQVAHACAFVINNSSVEDYRGKYFELNTGHVTDDKEQVFLRYRANNNFSIRKSADFSVIPGMPLAISLSDKMINLFGRQQLTEIAKPRQGLATGENNRFLRLWYEVAQKNVCYNAASIDESINSNAKWFPYNKGGEFRKWYGNNDYLVNWENDGYEIRNFYGDNGRLKSRPQNTAVYFRECVTWSKIATDTLAFRYKPKGHIFDVAGTSFFTDDKATLFYLQGLCNSCVAMRILKAISPTVNFEVGHIASLPVIVDSEKKNKVTEIVAENIEISKGEWDSFEVSWDFKKHPFIPIVSPVNDNLAMVWKYWEKVCDEHFNKLKSNEEKLNSIFIEIYGLQGEMDSSVDTKHVTIRKADLQREVKSFISYAVGCMFGRYSLDVEGLVYAGGEFDHSKYTSFPADRDNIIPICDDEYFEDDIVGRFIRFVETVYGKETLQENLKFIADALGGKGTPKEVIRNYFINDFYTDHLKMYQKRPIYWLFDSGKKNGFKALMYMHRYKEDTLARMRTDYVHEQQARYRTAIADLEHRIANAGTAEKVKLTKQLSALKDQETEIRLYEEKIHHLADQMIRIDLDDGVKNNYEIFKDVLAKLK